MDPSADAPFTDRMVRTKPERDMRWNRVIVVSNRAPFTYERGPAGTITVRRSAGGLVTALEPLVDPVYEFVGQRGIEVIARHDEQRERNGRVDARDRIGDAAARSERPRRDVVYGDAQRAHAAPSAR